MKKVLAIAGSDCSGGAGIQADMKTFAAHKMYGMTAITALTAQNTTGVYGISEVSPEFVGLQLDCIFTDIVPDAVKIGMVSSEAIIEIIASSLIKYNAVNIVIDPVMISTSGRELLDDSSREALVKRLLPMASLITPNIPEAECLSGMTIINGDDMLKAAESISNLVKCAVLLKGGHLTSSADDLLYEGGKATWYHAPRIDNPNTHGTGCTLSSAIACNLAMGCSMEQSVRNGKEYVAGALKAGLNLGKGNGPLNHCYK